MLHEQKKLSVRPPRLVARCTYACTCYGEAVLTPVDDLGARETVRTKCHDQPRRIYGKGMPNIMEAAPVVNHTDAEFYMPEGLVGHPPPFESPLY